MTPITDADLARYFRGAPQFSLVRRGTVAEEGEYALEPVVSFPFDTPDDERDRCDSRPPGHAAFALASSSVEEAALGMGVREVPSMRGFMGTEPGTVGWSYFLTLPVGDADREDDGFDNDVDEGGRERGGPSGERGGVRSVEVGYIVERLKELGNIWQAKKRRRKAGDTEPEDEEEEVEKKDVPPAVEMYTHLFTHLLYPPTRITTDDFHDPYSLKVQIMALIQVLSRKVWLDFSNVRWRIKLGQILWGTNATTPPPEEEEVDEEWESSAKESERVWLLLQVLLACELLIRLDSVLSDEDDGRRASVQSNASSTETKEQMMQRFREAGGLKVQWDILLARRWLDNIRIVEMDALKTTPAENKPEKSMFLVPARRWFTSQQPSPQPSDPPTPDAQQVTDALLLPRHPRRQVEGLLHFAKGIKWPNTDTLVHQVIAKAPGSPSSSVSGTPLASGGTPVSVSSAASYFSGAKSRTKRLRELDAPTLQRQKSSILTAPSVAGCGGWLSRSYLTGLILPGEGLNHLVISTLLENDPTAVEVLGYNANLYGGFQYLGKTWWSRYCIVGRVMAGYDGAGEECGWVGPVMASGLQVKSGDSEITVGGIPDGWIDVVTAAPPDIKTPRALEPKQLRQEGDARGKNWRNGTELRRNMFIGAKDAPVEDKDVHVEVRGLFFTPVEPADEDETEFQSFEVIANFLVGPKGGEKRAYELELRYDVSFVAAWPCYSEPAAEHRLHKSFEYEFARLEELDAKEEEEGESSSGGKITVVNTWAPEQRVFAYAWCAQRARSAVVATRGRTCAACAIREASALRLGVVIVA
ncbi:hypothetical protein FN846DRAFT_435672 [Sphaerosporella brunnea]|nr:hypothetical protein FN846DRAFT_435672 [Sphaerosporella brunnea]